MHKYEKIFSNLFLLFDKKEWDEVCGMCDIHHDIDKESECINFTFKFFRYPGANIIRKIYYFRNSHIKLLFDGSLFFFNEAMLKEIFIYCISRDLNLDFSFDPPNLCFFEKTIDESDIFNHFYARIKSLVQFLFNDFRVEVKGDKLFVPAEYKVDKPKFKSPEKRMFLFALEQKSSLKYNFGLTDWTNFYWFAEGKDFRENNKDFEDGLVVNRYYMCSFQVGLRTESSFIDGFLNSIRKIEDCEDSVEIDESENKIFPMCIHTKKSSFDGLYNSDDFVAEASKRGHGYIAITDMSSVQDFANLEKKAKKLGVKAIYGTELELIEKEYPIIVNDFEQWDGETICVFDIETTGLNSLVDEIIEIAISKFEFGQKMNEFHKLIRNSKPLKKHIVKITNINDELLRQKGKDPKVVLEGAREFIRGSLLIAHNGIAFDLPFLNAKLKEFGIDPIVEPLLDSMRFSQSLFVSEKYKSHSLGAVCKKAGVTYDETKAHRADYDVDVLWKVFHDYLLKNLQTKFGISLNKENLPTINSKLFKNDVLSCCYGNNVLIYAKNQKGIRSMYEIISQAHVGSYFGKPTVNSDLLENYKEDLIVVSPPIFSGLFELVLQNNKEEFARSIGLYDYVIIPPPSHFIHEIERESFSEEEIEFALKTFYEWCKEYSVKVLFNRCIRYLYPRDYERYLVLINSKGISGKRHPLYRSRGNPRFPDFSYKNTNEIIQEYEFLGSVEDLLNETWENQKLMLDSIDEDIEPVKKTLHAPTIEGCDAMIKEECMKRINSFYGENPDQYIMDKYNEEMKCILENNYAVIYWVSHLLVKESIKEGYLVGSRGSVGSSFVAFLLKISEVNPLPPHYFCRRCSRFELVEDFWESGFDLGEKQCEQCGDYMGSDGHNIPFETFLGFGGNKIPDIDLNFSGVYQNTAHNFLKKFFGDKRVYRAGTISATAEKSAFGLVKTYIEEIHDRENLENKHKTLFTHGKIKWLVQQIIDLKRTTGQHPGGILVVPEKYSIYDFTPVNYPANDLKSDWLTTHFEFDYLHDSLLKFDILGHDDPTTLAMLRDSTGLDPMDIPHHDPKVLELYRSCSVLNINPGELVNDDNTGAIGLPEFGTLLTRKIIKACQPKSFADLIRISGFSHGTGVWKKNIDGLVKSGHKLNEVITCRDDIMIYLLSKGLSREDSFKITEGIRKGNGITDENIELLKNHNVPDWYIESAKKISYIFPKAHATAYVLMSWKIAYYKLYYPLDFYSVYFTICHQTFDWELLRTNNFDLIKKTYQEIQRKVKSSTWKEKSTVTNKEKASLTVCEVALEFLKRGFKFKDIDVNKSSFDKFLIDRENNSIIIPFIVVDGLGEIKARTIQEEREKNGDYISFSNLIERTSINKKIVDTFKGKNIIPNEWIIGEEY